ncbi:type IV secretion system protein [Bulleidia sp. zg-1006]|uniref:type IV secretion system protein n=1 Tax=Bulleidia sp. zg-1006 TaxID=2806552 RepID=UPI00193AD89B|nr:type IV secretion system protein [Bulleidia sp. zg-1006]QRG86061.1 type IV secretion system protein [Bulleidia sp. zg-1006]
MDFLDNFGTTIVGVLLDITKAFEGLMDELKVTPKEFLGGGMWKTTQSISELLKPIAWTLLILFFLLELMEQLKKKDMQQDEAMYEITWILVKLAIAKLIADNVADIINLIFATSKNMVTTLEKGKALVTVGQDTSKMQTFMDKIEQTYNGWNKGLGDKLINYLLVTIMKLGSDILKVLAKIVIQIRNIEIYVHIALGSIISSTIISKEYNDIFKRWIKKLVALALQVILISVCILVYYQYINVIDYPSDINGMWIIIGGQILLVMSMFQTGGWAKSLLGV